MTFVCANKFPVFCFLIQAVHIHPSSTAHGQPMIICYVRGYFEGIISTVSVLLLFQIVPYYCGSKESSGMSWCKPSHSYWLEQNLASWLYQSNSRRCTYNFKCEQIVDFYYYNIFNVTGKNTPFVDFSSCYQELMFSLFIIIVSYWNYY